MTGGLQYVYVGDAFCVRRYDGQEKIGFQRFPRLFLKYLFAGRVGPLESSVSMRRPSRRSGAGWMGVGGSWRPRRVPFGI